MELTKVQILDRTYTKLIKLGQITERVGGVTTLALIVKRLTGIDPGDDLYGYLHAFSRSKADVAPRAPSRTTPQFKEYRPPAMMRVAAKRASIAPAPVPMGMDDDIHKVCYGF